METKMMWTKNSISMPFSKRSLTSLMALSNLIITFMFVFRTQVFEPKIMVSMKNLPNLWNSLHKSHMIVRLSISQICRTSVFIVRSSVSFDSPYHRVFVAVFRCIFWGLVLPLSHLTNHPVQEWSGLLSTFLILLRCKNSSYRFQQWICPCAVRLQQVSLFYLPSIHQISTL